MKVGIEFEVDERDAARLIAAARAQAEGGRRIESVEEAVAELARSHPLMRSERIRTSEIWREAAEEDEDFDAVPGAGPYTAHVYDEDAAAGDRAGETVFYPAAYLCRWPNGEFSIVVAHAEEDVVLLLDEWGDADSAEITAMSACMLDFGLSDKGEIELRDMGEETAEIVWERCYPELQATMTRIYVADRQQEGLTAEATERIRRAVIHERERMMGAEPERVQEMKKLARDLLRSKAGEGGKPN